MDNEPEIQSASELLGTKITVNGKEIIFYELTIHEAISDTCSFSFNWRQAEEKFSINSHHDFYSKNLGSEVVITIGTKFNFKGFIHAITCFNQEDFGVEYKIEGKGAAGGLEMGLACKSFHKKKLSEIIKDVLNGTGVSIKLNIENDIEVYYTVQYNQSIWDFLCMLAARNGLWFYYNGVELYMGKLKPTTTKLTNGSNLFNWQFTGKVIADNLKAASFDIFKGKDLKGKENLNGLKEFYEAAVKGGKKINKTDPKQHSPHEVVEANLKSGASANLESVLSNSVLVSGNTYAVELRSGVTVTINNLSGSSQGDYVVTSVKHHCKETYHYSNSFTAIPARAKVPPNTQSLLHPIAVAQPAKVINNEDKDGLDRIKVRFPWQEETEQSPWLPVLVPHAGKQKGFRFLPEVDDIVMVGFIDDNAERPYIMGSFYNESQKSEIGYEKNTQKFIGSVSGRRITWDEEKNEFIITDNYKKDDKIREQNKIKFKLSEEDNEVSILLQSTRGSSNIASILLKGDDKVSIQLGGKEDHNSDPLVGIEFNKGKGSDSNLLKIFAEGEINIESKKAIKMKAPEIVIDQDKMAKITMKDGKLSTESTKDTEIKSTMGLKLEASLKAEMKGSAAISLEGAMAELKGSAMTTIKGGMVMIN